MAAELNWIDAALSAAVLASAAFGLFRGLIRGVFGIASLIVAFFVARQYGSHVAEGITALLGESDFTVALGYAFVFAIAMIAFAALTYVIRSAAARADLGAMDKFGGFLFGALRGGLFAFLIVFVLAFLPVQNSAAWRESVLLPMFGAAIQFAVASEKLSDYERYWRFDEEHRPRLAFLAAVSGRSAPQERKPERRSRKDSSPAEEQSLARDDELDSLAAQWAGEDKSVPEQKSRRELRREQREQKEREKKAAREGRQAANAAPPNTLQQNLSGILRQVECLIGGGGGACSDGEQ